MIVAVIGAGFVGRAWAISFARAGHEVRLWDSKPDAPAAAISYIGGILPDLAANDLLEGRSQAEVLARIRPVTELTDALDGAGHVQENTPEDVATKRAVFADLDRLAPKEAVLASSTSAILPSAFLSEVPGRSRCLVCHPINPPYLVPAVEVCPSPWTAATAVAQAAEFMRGCGQVPIVMRREIDGFIMNRLQGAVLEEAFRLVADGVASIEDVDVGLREGLALRWCFMGPFETIDLNAPEGVRDYAERYQNIYERIFPSTQRRVDWSGRVMDRIEADRRESLPASGLAARQAWRDRRLMALVAHKKAAKTRIGE